MATPPVVFDFVGVVFTAVFYGLYCLLFALYWQIQLKRADRRRGVVFFSALTFNFILCTAYFIIAIILVQLYITTSVLNEDSLGSAADWMVVANNALYTAIDFIAQLILIYRCWIMWRQPWVMIIPCILSLAFLVTALTTLGFYIKSVADNVPLPDWYLSTVTAFFFISLGVNALVTALIVYKIIIVYNEIRGISAINIRGGAHGNGRPDLNPLISILIESGLITFVGQLAQSIMFWFASDAFPLISGCVVMLYGISMVVVLVRVETGVSYENNTLRTVNSTNSRRSLQRTPFALKFNQATKVEQSDSSNDAHSGSSYTRIDTGTLPEVILQNLNYSSVTTTSTYLI